MYREQLHVSMAYGMTWYGTAWHGMVWSGIMA